MTRQITSRELADALARPAPPPTPPAERTPPRRLEAAWTTWVITTARWYGWRVTHFRPARTASGRWATPLQGDKGFPDLVLARAGDVIFAELKTDTGRLAPDQQAWLDALGPAAVVWRPRDRDTVITRLRKDSSR